MKTIEGMRKVKITFDKEPYVNIGFFDKKIILSAIDEYSGALIEIELTSEDLSIINGFSQTTTMPVLQETLPTPEKKDEKKGGGEGEQD